MTPKNCGTFPLIPAYGRDYTNAEDAKAAFLSGEDWQTALGQYCSKRDFPGLLVTLRYSRQRKVMTVSVQGSEL